MNKGSDIEGTFIIMRKARSRRVPADGSTCFANVAEKTFIQPYTLFLYEPVNFGL